MSFADSEANRLRIQLQTLLQKAAENQRILEHFQHFELGLLGCRSIVDLLDHLLIRAREHFELEACRLVWFDPENTVRELLLPEDAQRFEGSLEFVNHFEPFSKIYGNRYRPMLRTLNEIDKARWFPWVASVESCAMLPLLRENTIIGSLHMGSASRTRFTPDKAVDFMARLASIVSVCLENGVNHEHLRRLSLIDMLTRVKNRRSFDQDLSRELSRAVRNMQPLSCLFIDVDHFKKVNDSHGHQAGDVALKQIAQLVRRQLRQTDHLARYGGEEFAALLPDCHRETAIHIAERIRRLAESTPIVAEGVKPFHVTLSIGLCTWQPQPGGARDDGPWVGQRLVANADAAVYDAKRSGRNRVCVKSFEAVINAENFAVSR
jgi:diguanylate cyclase (GGDEF)-like protein